MRRPAGTVSASSICLQQILCQWRDEGTLTAICYGNGEHLYMYLNTHSNRDFKVYVNGVEVEVNVPLDCSASITPVGQLADGEQYEIVIYSEDGGEHSEGTWYRLICGYTSDT